MRTPNTSRPMQQLQAGPRVAPAPGELHRVRIVGLDPRSDPRWERLVVRRGGTLFNSPAWLGTVADTYGFTPEAYLALDAAGEPTAGLAFCRVDDALGRRIVSFPFSDYSDPLVEDRATWDGLVERLSKAGVPITLRCLRNPLPPSDERFGLTKAARWHRIDLRPGPDALWDGLDESARRAIRKARKNGVAIRFADDEATLRTFFRMHLEVRKYKYRLLAQPYAFFERIWERFIVPGRGTIAAAMHDGEMVGAIFFVEFGDTLYYKFNASSRAHLELRMNDLMLWESIRHARERGAAYMDLGLSDADQDGLIRYKRKYAGEEDTISFLRHVPAEAPEPNRQFGAVLGQLTELLVDPGVPDPITERAGALLYRFFV